MTQAEAPRVFFERLKHGLRRSADALGLGGLLNRRRLDTETVAALEESLIRADLGTESAHAIVAAIAAGRYEHDISEAEVRGLLGAEIAKILAPVAQPFAPDWSKKPFVVLVVGVNGTGKTTTIGKIAANLQQNGHKVLLAAADTFRAAAIEQLRIWAGRAGADVIARPPGADAAGLAFDAVKRARETGADIVLIDTAGRMQNKAGLMAELEKVVRVLRKVDAEAPHAGLLVLDATTGQNAVSQVEAFSAAVPLSGLVMTKLDGTAKGGILVALAARFELPVHFIGVGEGEDDLQTFDAQAFARALTEVW
jgi:fused signal recognition particle receptor